MEKVPAHIVVIGGGTGGFTLLSALKHYCTQLTALVNMADDGGSTGVLRDELGVLPPGDVRKTLVALSESPKVRELFDYRFDEGGLSGHTFGNLFLTAHEKMTGSFAEGVEIASHVLNITGRVLPITLDNIRLVVTWPDKKSRVHGQGNINNTHFASTLGKPTLHLEPEATVYAEAAKAIAEADLVVISAGDIYTSIGPSLAVGGVSEALKTTKASVVYVCNLVTKPGHTDGFTVGAHVDEIERMAGAPIVDYVLYNTARPAEDLFDKYIKEGELLVQADEAELNAAHYKAVGAPLLANDIAPKIKGDALAAHRSLIRHDGHAVATMLVKLLPGARIDG